MLRATVAAYAGAGADLWLPLTGGIDSRLVLAAAAAEGVRVTTYTFHRPGLAYADAALPPRLATAVGAPHVAIHPGPVHPGRRSLYDVHCAGHSVEVDRELFARGEWDEVPHHALSLRGGVFEAGRCFYHGRLPRRLPDDVDDAHSMLRTLFQFDRFHAGSAAHDDGLARWLAWAAGTPEPGLDWRDRLYLEQTTAGWLGSTAQALDLFACELAYPANSRALLSALLALDEGARCGGDHHRDLIARMAPDLLSLPINPPGPVTARAASLVRREWHDLRAYPGRMTYVRHRLRWIRDRARRARGGL
jgi:hypothetical protein